MNFLSKNIYLFIRFCHCGFCHILTIVLGERQCCLRSALCSAGFCGLFLGSASRVGGGGGLLDKERHSPQPEQTSCPIRQRGQAVGSPQGREHLSGGGSCLNYAVRSPEDSGSLPDAWWYLPSPPSRAPPPPPKPRSRTTGSGQ